MDTELKPLSQRELECLVRVQRHLSTKEIAAELELSPHTVSDYIKRACEKLGVNSRIEAVRQLSLLKASSGVSAPPLGEPNALPKAPHDEGRLPEGADDLYRPAQVQQATLGGDGDDQSRDALMVAQRTNSTPLSIPIKLGIMLLVAFGTVMLITATLASLNALTELCAAGNVCGCRNPREEANCRLEETRACHVKSATPPQRRSPASY